MYNLQGNLFNFYLFCIMLQTCTSLLSSDVKWTHELILETDFQVRWDSQDPDFLTMEIKAPTRGYLGIGFSVDGEMSGSDIMMAWVDDEGVPHVNDYHGVGKVEPIEDPQQDYFLIAASERDNQTVIRFHRRWETCDELHDINIGNDTMNLIWAWHTDDPTSSDTGSSFSWHGTENRGSRNVHMRLPSRPELFPDGTSGLEEPPPNIKIWDLALENVDIDGSTQSFFMCKLFKLLHLSHLKQHLIGFRPLITEENEENIHSISVHQCHIPENVLQTEINLKRSQEEQNGNSSSWTKYCNEPVISWAFGSEGEMFPNHVGMLLAESHLTKQQHPHHHLNSAPYFKLEVHYDNLAGKQFLDSSGIRLFYTESRIYTGGVLRIGHRVSPFLAVPPSQENFKIYSICSSDCTRNGIPESGINVFSVMLHSHETGKKIRLRHVRNGKELWPIAEDGNYTYKYQPYRILRNEVRIFPGDELVLECEYNTMYRDKFTFGGYSTLEEMCNAHLLYYPKVNLTLCESKPEFQSFFSAFGIQSVMGDGLMRLDHHPQKEGADLLPPQFALEQWPRPEDMNPYDAVFITEPHSLFNISVAERLNNFDWREKNVAKKLENSWRNGRHFMYCEGTSEIPYNKYVTEMPKFQSLKKKSNSICRKSRHRHSGEEKTSMEVLLIAFALFIKIIFDPYFYLIN